MSLEVLAAYADARTPPALGFAVPTQAVEQPTHGSGDGEPPGALGADTITPHQHDDAIHVARDPVSSPGTMIVLRAQPTWAPSVTTSAKCSGPPNAVINENARGSNSGNGLGNDDMSMVEIGSGNGSTAGDSLGDVGRAASVEPNATLQRLLKVQAAAAAAAFNLAYEQDNNTPLYDRLRVAPLRLGSGVAVSALPVSTALPAPVMTQGSQHAAASHFLAAGGPAAHAGGSGAAARSSGGRPLKRRRLDGDTAAGEGGAGGSFTLAPELAFVLNRCWNCGSYGHDLRSCKRPRHQASIDTRQREFSESRGAVLAEQRKARQAAAGAQRRGPRHKASHGRYFSAAVAGEEEHAATGADVAERAVTDSYDPAQALTQAPPGVRPGVLSAALAAALDLKCPLDPPPWLVSMALHGIPPAYCCGPYLTPAANSTAAEAAAEPPTAAAAASVIADTANHLTGAAQAVVESAAAEDRRGPSDMGNTATADEVEETAAVGPQAAADEQLLRPLLPDAQCHVQYAGLNAPLESAACRDRWRRALGGARQAVAFVEAVQGMVRWREQRQQTGQERQPEQPEQQGQPSDHRGGQQQLQSRCQMEGQGGQQQQMMAMMCWQQQQQMFWQQQQQQQMLCRQQQLEHVQQQQFLQGQQQQFRAAQGIPFFFGGPNFQGQGQGATFPGSR